MEVKNYVLNLSEAIGKKFKNHLGETYILKGVEIKERFNSGFQEYFYYIAVSIQGKDGEITIGNRLELKLSDEEVP